MLGPEYKWLLAPVRPGATSRVQLARHSLLTLAVAGCCLLGTFLPSGPTLAPAAAATTPVVAAIEQTPPEWPRTVIRLWFLLPQLLPSQN